MEVGDIGFIHKYFAVVMCNDKKQSVQKHNQIDYQKATYEDVLSNIKDGGMTGILTGVRSNNLEIMDFDLKNAENAETFMRAYIALVIGKLGQEFFDRMVIQKTPSGGEHWMYRTSKVDGNKKISKGQSGEAIVESRGNGGYFIVAPSKGYTLTMGSIKEIPVITPEEKDALWLCAKALEEYNDPNPQMKAHAKKLPTALVNEIRNADGQPNYWENFDQDADYLTMLETDGWRIPQYGGNKGNGKYLLVRPDKTADEWSADLELTGHGVPLLYVYSTSTVLESEKAYSPSSYLIYYRFNGDTIAAYDWLIDNGFAPPRKEKKLTKATIPETQHDAGALFDKYAHMKITEETYVEKPVPILIINGVGVLHTGELLTLSGESKSGKSALLSAIISKVLNNEAQGFEIIRTEKNEWPILHFDTEQPVHRHKNNLMYHIMKRAGLDKCPDQLMSYNLRSMPIMDRRAMVTEVIESAKIRFGGVFMVILDGSADFIMDTNNIEQSADIVHWMLTLSTTYNCGVINVIHLNPSADGTYVKQRGHLGSELQRKTDNLLVVKKDISQGREQSVLTAQYLRNGGIFKFGDHYIHYDEKSMMHQLLSAEDMQEESPTEKFKIMARRLAGMTLEDGRRSLLDEGVVKSIPQAKKLIRDLEELQYIVISEGKIMSKGNLTAKKLIPIEKAIDAEYIESLKDLEKPELQVSSTPPPF